MLNLISYIFFFLGNFLIIIFIPNHLVQEFLTSFSIFSLIIGPLNFLLFSKFFNQKEYFLYIILLINLYFFIFINDFKFLILIYTINLFFSDFLTSQLKNVKFNFVYKLIFFFTPFFLLLKIINFEELLILRIIISTFLIIIVLVKKSEHMKLEVKYPVMYQFLTNVNYYIPLFITTLILSNFSLKITYIIFQIGFGVILKYFDLRIRKIINATQFNFYGNFLNIIIFILPIILIYYKIPVIIYIMYYLSVIIFLFVKKKFIYE
tara:strand:+ start:1976 stop:2767 length:792 start_codon:yes stop_codon:yes gene_type:complete